MPVNRTHFLYIAVIASAVAFAVIFLFMLNTTIQFAIGFLIVLGIATGSTLLRLMKLESWRPDRPLI